MFNVSLARRADSVTWSASERAETPIDFTRAVYRKYSDSLYLHHFVHWSKLQ